MAPTATDVTDAATAWLRCDSCQAIAYWKKWRRSHGLCPVCGHASKLTPAQRLASLVDDGSFEPFEVAGPPEDPLRFEDTMPYPERLRRARQRTGLSEAAVVGTARIEDIGVVVGVMDFRFLGGSLGVGAGELLTAAAEHALAARLPLLLVTASGGARMQEGVLSLMQMAKVSQAMAALRENGVLTISLITDPTYGGVAASFATQSDVLIAEPSARLGFAGPRVIQQTVGRELPPGFQTAEFLFDRGLLDLVVPRSRLRDRIAALLKLVTAKREIRAEWRAGVVPEVESAADGWSVVQAARDPARPTMREYVGRMCESFVELHGDRLQGDSQTIVGGIGTLAGRSVMVVGTQKGHSTAELVATSFGMAGPEGYRKAQRLFGLAERLSLPVVTLIDTPGAHPGMEAEEGGQALTIAESILQLTSLATPVVSVIVGEGGSGGALALGIGDRVLMSRHATYSVISPEGCAAILWGPGHAPRAANALRLTAPDLLELGVIDRIVPEPAGGAQADPLFAADLLCAELDAALREVEETPAAELVARRRERLRTLGSAAAEPPKGQDAERGAAQ
jgi:acetyl-CoA carboxylase carboxyl transferase beta subunit/acetyl-CoA carboxylase carboxyl transferase alpha subunit